MALSCFSDLKTLDDLKSVCTKELQVNVICRNPKSEDLVAFRQVLFANTEMYASAKEKWIQLFHCPAPEDGGDMVFPTTSRILSDLAIVIRNNSGQGLYKNGSVKMLLYTVMRLGSDDTDDVGAQPTFFTRISTTTDPCSDACGLKCASEVLASKREDALNGRHILVLCPCNNYGYIIISGVPDALMEGSVQMMTSKPFAIGEGKGVGPGEAQLLGAVIKCWAIHGVYPIGEFTINFTEDLVQNFSSHLCFFLMIIVDW